MRILGLRLRPAFTSRGDPTVEAEVWVEGGHGRVASPVGASAGVHEAVHLPKGGAEEAIRNVMAAKERIIGLDASDFKGLAEALRDIDGTPNFSRIGGASAFAITVAAAEAEAKAENVPLYRLLSGGREVRIPFPLGNVLGGGKHAGPGSPDIQEFLVVPIGAPNIFEAIRANLLVHKKVRKLIEKKDPAFSGGKGDEGAWAPKMKDEEAFEIVSTAAEEVSKELGFRVGFGIDMAASSLWKDGKYRYERKGKSLSTEEQISYVEELVDRYGLTYVEDPIQEEDFGSFAKLTKRLSGRTKIVGDDLFVTNVERLRKGIEVGAANGVILKVNQIGPLYEALEFANLARSNGYRVITSHRSGDTWDPHLAHIALGAGSWLIKTGVVGGERMSKLMELYRVWEAEPGLRMANA